MSRHDRRRFRHQVSGAGLLTYLVSPTDPRLGDVPLLGRAARWWTYCLPNALPPRSCMLCKRSLRCEQDVGLVLLSMPAAPTTCVAYVGLCLDCYRDADWVRIEAACIAALQEVLPAGKFS